MVMLITSFQSSDFIIFKNILHTLFFYSRDYAPVSCPEICQTTNVGISIQSKENMSDSALQVSSKWHLSSSSTKPIMPHYEFSSALASKHWLVLLFLMPPHCGCDMSSVLLRYSVSLCVLDVCWGHTSRIQIEHATIRWWRRDVLKYIVCQIYTMWLSKILRYDIFLQVVWIVSNIK